MNIERRCSSPTEDVIKRRCPSPIENKDEKEALIDKRKEQLRGYGD
jgi:hypothetical protein